MRNHGHAQPAQPGVVSYRRCTPRRLRHIPTRHRYCELFTVRHPFLFRACFPLASSIAHCVTSYDRAITLCYPLVSSVERHPLFTAQRLAGVDQPPPTTPEEEANFRLPVIKNITPRLRLQGLACYAHMNFYAGWADGKGAPTVGSILSAHNGMFNACSAANICVSLGFVPPVAIRIAAYMATTEARFGVDLREAPRYKELRHLWAMHRNYLARLQVKEAARLKRVAKAPHLYRCANTGCPIQASTLR